MSTAQREQYTFKVLRPGQESYEMVVSIDPNSPLMENWIEIVHASKGTANEISLVRADGDGEAQEIPWEFGWCDDSTGQEEFEELDPMSSLMEQGVYPGAEIVIADQSMVGAARRVGDGRHAA